MFSALLISTAASFELYEPLPATGVTFKTSDAALQKLYDHGATQEAANAHPFLLHPLFKGIIEGEQYRSAWLETQPMAGAMYAARDVRLALHNQLIFIRAQRRDGRFPHRVDPCPPNDLECRSLHPGWHLTLQGLFMAMPSVDVAFFIRFAGTPNKADKYLQELAGALEGYDRYLWGTRNDSACFALLNYSEHTPNCPAVRSSSPADARGLLWVMNDLCASVSLYLSE